MSEDLVLTLDHLVLSVADAERSVAFYSQCLGMRPVTFGDNRRALLFGASKINLHEVGHEIAPYAKRPTPGSADLCFLVSVPVARLRAKLVAAGLECTEPAPRTGARHPLLSFYLRDPDGNLIELANECPAPAP